MDKCRYAVQKLQFVLASKWVFDFYFACNEFKWYGLYLTYSPVYSIGHLLLHFIWNLTY